MPQRSTAARGGIAGHPGVDHVDLYPFGFQRFLQTHGICLVTHEAKPGCQRIAEGHDLDRLCGRSGGGLRKGLACHQESQNQHNDVREVRKAPLDPTGRLAI
jgi:hypothetical protein